MNLDNKIKLGLDFGYSTLQISSARNFQSDSFQGSPNKAPIKTFSKASRKKLLFKLQLIDYSLLKKFQYTCFFATLTYQNSFYLRYKSPEAIKIDLDNFRRYFSRKFGDDYFFFYKLEFTKAAIPHFHLFIVLKSYISITNMRYFVSRTWATVITSSVTFLSSDTSQPANLKKLFVSAGTQVSVVDLDNVDCIFSYINKEVSKNIQVLTDQFFGRYWGIYGRTFYSKCILYLHFSFSSQDSFFRFRRLLFHWLKSKGLSYKCYRRSVTYNPFSGLTIFYVRDILSFLRAYEYVQDSYG